MSPGRDTWGQRGLPDPHLMGATYHRELAVPEPHHPAGALGCPAPARHPPGDDAPGPPGEAAQFAPHQLADTEAPAILHREEMGGRSEAGGEGVPASLGGSSPTNPSMPSRPCPHLVLGLVIGRLGGVLVDGIGHHWLRRGGHVGRGRVGGLLRGGGAGLLLLLGLCPRRLLHHVHHGDHLCLLLRLGRGHTPVRAELWGIAHPVP